MSDEDFGFRVPARFRSRMRRAVAPVALMLIVLIGAWLVALDAFAR